MENEQLDIEFEVEQPKHGKRVYVYLVVLSILIIAMFVVKANWQQHVPVKNISIEGINVISKDEIVRLMKLPPNVPMYDIDLTMIQKNILSNSFVKNVVIQRDAPSTLRVIIEERIPSALLVGNELFYISADGTVLPYVTSTETYDIPIISGVDSLSGIKTGQKIYNQDVREALEIIAVSQVTSNDLFHAISEIRLRKGHDIVLYTFDNGAPIIFGKGDAVKKLVKLDTFWQNVLKQSDSKNIQYIDIRFDDQVVVSTQS